MKVFYFLFLLFISATIFAQNFNGQWKGGFSETSYGISSLGSNDIDYVLELQTEGSSVTGYSYTYFREGGKRYYTICKLTGILNRATKEIIVTETERTKFNTPPDFQNCFQTHKLHYVQDSADVEMLKGTWMPAPNQNGNCGYGTTVLSRRIIKKLPMGITATEKKPEKKFVPKKQVVASKQNESNPKKLPPVKPNSEKVKPQEKNETIHDEIVTRPLPEKPAKITVPSLGYKSRRKDIIKTIHIDNETFKIDFYD
ncbi:MAG: hypothetical protein M3Z56_11480, partial [Bacteroidota bacterium]|nr:hypothetical protein [Bacteroidota bacterium]